MIEFWTILVITYSGELLEGNVSRVALPSHKDCEEAMTLTYEALYPHMNDIMIQCTETPTPSNTIRPKPRPKDLK
jgi:hypothetical protein